MLFTQYTKLGWIDPLHEVFTYPDLRSHLIVPLIRTLWASSVRSMARSIMGRKGNPSWVTSGTHDGAQTGPMIGSTKRPNYIIAFPLFNSLRLPRDSNGPSWINVLQRLRPILYRSSHSPNRRRGEASSGRYVPAPRASDPVLGQRLT